MNVYIAEIARLEERLAYENTEFLLRMQTLRHALNDREEEISNYKLEEIKYERIIMDMREEEKKNEYLIRIRRVYK